MNIINLHKYPKFWADFTNRLRDAKMYTGNEPVTVANYEREITQWYGYTAIGSAHRRITEVVMDEHQLTMFLLRWS